MDDEQIYSFIREHFDSDLLRAFRQMPLAVMRADIWRYAVLWVHGGVYSDLDSECIEPLDDWLPADKDLVVALENRTHFAQTTIAACSRHKVFRYALELVLKRWSAGPRISDPHFVHYHTGPGLWTSAVCRHLGCGDIPAGQALEEYGTRDARAWFLDEEAFMNGYVHHLYGSQRWRGEPGYDSWIDQRDRLLVDRLLPVLNEGWTTKVEGGQYLLVSMNGRTALPCNDSTRGILALCDGTRTVAEIARELRAAVPSCQDDIEGQVLDTVLTLQASGVVDMRGWDRGSVATRTPRH